MANWIKRWQDKRFWIRHNEIVAKAAAERHQTRREAALRGWATRRRRKAERALKEADGGT